MFYFRFCPLELLHTEKKYVYVAFSVIVIPFEVLSKCNWKGGLPNLNESFLAIV